MAEYKVGSLGNLISGTSSSNAGSTIIYEEVIPNWNAARIVKQSGDDCLGSTNTSGVSTLNGKRKNIKNKIARSFLSKKKPEIAGDDISFNIAKSWRHLPPSEKDFEVDGENSFSRNAARRVHIKNNSKKHVNDPEREAKTVFVGNIPYAHAKKKKIAKFFSQYGDVESVRFRCAPLKDPRMSKKVAVIKHDFHPDRSSICSYVVFRTAKEAKSALQANGLIYHDHHLRVDLAVNASSRDVDSKKSVFIGNLAFSAEEEDLWQLFSSCGAIESVRIVRDPITAVSKGIAFVNFEASDGAELALQLDGSDVRKRKLSVKRHRNFAKQSSEVLPSKRVVWHKDTNQIENNGKDKRKTMEEEIRLIKKDKRRMRREGEKLLGIKKKKSSSSKFVESKLDLPENNPEHGRSGVVEVGEKNGPKVRKKSGKMLGTAKKKKTVNGVVDEALSGVSALIPLEPEPKELRIPKSSFKNMKYQGQTVEDSQKKKKKINKGELKKKKMAQMLTIGLKKKRKKSIERNEIVNIVEFAFSLH